MKNILLLLALFACLNTQAQERHPINRVSAGILKTAYATSEMMEGAGVAYKGWDQLLNVVYNELRETMKPTTFAALRDAQRAWIQFRDAEFQTIQQIYYGEMEGTMWRPVAVDQRTKIVRQRAEFLLEQYELLTMTYERVPKTIKKLWRVTNLDIEARIDIREDLTSVWYDLEDEEYQVKFYRLTTNCSGDEAAPSSKTIEFFPMGENEKSQCYFIENLDTKNVQLRAVDSDEVLKMKTRQ